MPTHDKSDVDYSAGKPNAYCGICDNFRFPNRCIEVRGEIDAVKWCQLFTPRKSLRETVRDAIQ